MTRLDTYDAKYMLDAGEPAVRYWSVHQQVWMMAYFRGAVPARDLAALDEHDRELICRLPM